MIKLLDKLKKYLLDVLDCPVSTVKWEEANQLPLFLRDGYEYYRISVLNSSYLLMIAADNKEQQPAMVRKHLFKVKEKSAYDVIYMKETVTSYNRKRLIENKVPFIIPGNQMYLPMLGIDLREHFRKQQEETISFSPSTQAVVLYAIYHREVEVFTPGHLTKHLGYTAMTMTRVFDELQQAGIGEHSVNGRERFIHFNHKGRKFWEKALRFMSSPVKKQHHILLQSGQESGIHAGLDALARYTMLSESKNAVYAFAGSKWKSYRQKQQITEVPMPEPNSTLIEVWSYDPGLFANYKTVDKLSLYLSLRDTKDERIEAALNRMLEEMPW